MFRSPVSTRALSPRSEFGWRYPFRLPPSFCTPSAPIPCWPDWRHTKPRQSLSALSGIFVRRLGTLLMPLALPSYLAQQVTDLGE